MQHYIYMYNSVSVIFPPTVPVSGPRRVPLLQINLDVLQARFTCIPATLVYYNAAQVAAAVTHSFHFNSVSAYSTPAPTALHGEGHLFHQRFYLHSKSYVHEKCACEFFSGGPPKAD